MVCYMIYIEWSYFWLTLVTVYSFLGVWFICHPRGEQILRICLVTSRMCVVLFMIV